MATTGDEKPASEAVANVDTEMDAAEKKEKEAVAGSEGAEAADAGKDAAAAGDEKPSEAAADDKKGKGKAGPKPARVPGEIPPHQLQKILKQVEFYFSDSNLVTDKFLRTKMKENPEGFVPLSVICSFSRMRGHLGVTTYKKVDGKEVWEVQPAHIDAVAEVLRKSDDLVISDDGKLVRRKHALPGEEALGELTELQKSRSLAAWPFPWDSKLDTLQAFFAAEGEIKVLRMLRHSRNSKEFKGVVTIEFGSKEEAAAVAAKELEHAGVKIQMVPLYVVHTLLAACK
eukprot:jgi/Mesvir1/11804/Mv00163-RA.3